MENQNAPEVSRTDLSLPTPERTTLLTPLLPGSILAPQQDNAFVLFMLPCLYPATYYSGFKSVISKAG